MAVVLQGVPYSRLAYPLSILAYPVPFPAYPVVVVRVWPGQSGEYGVPCSWPAYPVPFHAYPVVVIGFGLARPRGSDRYGVPRSSGLRTL